MGKGGKALCVVLALLVAIFGFYANFERTRANGLEQSLTDLQTALDEQISINGDLSLRAEQLEARVESLSGELEDVSSELANMYIAPRVTN